MRCLFCKTGQIAFNICDTCGGKFCGRCRGLIEYGCFIGTNVEECKCDKPVVIEKKKDKVKKEKFKQIKKPTRPNRHYD